MSPTFLNLKYPTTNQLEIWLLNRKKLTGVKIAEIKQISRPAVSKTLKEANSRIESLLKNAANMNKIQINKMSPELGFLVGFSCIFKVKVYITYSPVNGVQVWYEHNAHCEKCDELVNCRNLIFQEYKERNINVENPQLRPSDLGERLFKLLEEKME